MACAQQMTTGDNENFSRVQSFFQRLLLWPPARFKGFWLLLPPKKQTKYFGQKVELHEAILDSNKMSKSLQALFPNISGDSPAQWESKAA